MFWLSDVNTIRVNKNRKAGAPNKDKTDFDKFLMGTTYTEGYLNSILTRTSGLKCGIVLTAQTTTSLPTTAALLVPGLSRVTVI